MASVFDEILLKGIRSGHAPAKEQAARDWFRSTAKKTTKTKANPTAMMKSDKARLKTRPAMGALYSFYYDPKHKKTLPYFDRFPLVFPFGKAKDGFMGLNMHYLPPPFRAKLMDALYETASNKRFNDATKLKISYETLKGASKYKWYKPCVKHYLVPHMRSRFFQVYSAEWDIALFLPTAQFEGATQTKVWADSRKIIRGK